MEPKEITVPELVKRLGRKPSFRPVLDPQEKIPGRKTAIGWVTTQAAVENYLDQCANPKSRSK